MRYFFLAIILILYTSQPLQAQDRRGEPIVSASINVSASVIPSIELITVNSMTFPNLQPGQREIYVNPVNSLNAGFMIAVGMPNTEFRLNYLPERELTQVDGNSTLTFTYELSGNSEENQSTSELLELDNRNIEFNEEGRYYIWVGGRVNIENAAPGNYEGDFTIEIDYI
ncbi:MULTISPECIES: DUF4402 domain-containing protein [Gracilimonas]|uniref:DUF4402 domain-containing protein n=1 Tax=Gracilimonas sediminicola TaxID=2952158 RepID=A0A9X2L0H3_9BACT|nr:DUF4402 domain-containing protein [Gracilimonas sediminicola]MCP9290086.1 DUF4402 domain-containing protein [Gracilimonas sediminicola]